jgi:hypothetical protein
MKRLLTLTVLAAAVATGTAWSAGEVAEQASRIPGVAIASQDATLAGAVDELRREVRALRESLAPRGVVEGTGGHAMHGGGHGSMMEHCQGMMGAMMSTMMPRPRSAQGR